MSLAASLSGKLPPFDNVNCVLKIFPVVSPKSRKETIFLVSLVVPVLLVIHTSTLVILTGELTNGN